MITTEYAGNYVYENSILQFFNTAEGYVEPKGTGWEYVFQYKDHPSASLRAGLGNIRLSYADADGNGIIAQTEIREENNYYPFGLKHKGYNNLVTSTNPALKFKYNGVEYEESLGMNLYEMDVRSYDPAIARFTSLDPVTHFDYSTYSAFDNNPVFWADPSGADSVSKQFEQSLGADGLTNEQWIELSRPGGGGFDAMRNQARVNRSALRDLRNNEEQGFVEVGQGNFFECLSIDCIQQKRHPKKIDFRDNDDEIIQAIVEWAIYIRNNNNEKIFLSDIVIDVKVRRKRTVWDMFLDLGGNGTYINRKTIIDAERNTLEVGFFRQYLEPNAFSDNSIISVYFAGEIGPVGGGKSRYDIKFEGYPVDSGVPPTLFYMNFVGKNFYDSIKGRIENPHKVIE